MVPMKTLFMWSLTSRKSIYVVGYEKRHSVVLQIKFDAHLSLSAYLSVLAYVASEPQPRVQQQNAIATAGGTV